MIWQVVGDEYVRCRECGGLEPRDPVVDAPRVAGHERYSARHLAALAAERRATVARIYRPEIRPMIVVGPDEEDEAREAAEDREDALAKERAIERILEGMP